MGIRNRLYTIPLRVRSLLRRKRVEQELDDEFQFHLEQLTEAGIGRGLTEGEARREALRALDNIPLRKEECRDWRGFRLLDDLAQDLRYATRTLRRAPAFAAVAIVSLALGIGANTAIFSVMDVLLLRPLAVPQADRLQMVTLAGKRGPRYSFNYPLFNLVRDRNEVFSTTFAWSTTQLQTPLNGDMLLIPAVYASGDYFRGLGAGPAAGRAIGRDDDLAGGGKNGAVAVISNGYWARRYGRSGSAIGQSIVLNGVPVTIVGVMPAGFFGSEVGTGPDVWVPLNLQRQLENPRCISSADCWYLKVMGRLKPGVSTMQAQAEFRAISRRILEDDNPPARADRRADFLAQILEPERGAAGYTGLRERIRGPLNVLMALVGFVLLIACANLANLLTARASARQREVAVRLAIGAARGRLIRQLVTESLLLAMAGAVGGFAVAYWATRVLIDLLSTTAVLDLRPDWRVLLFTAATTVATGLLFGLAPAFRATRAGAGSALKERAHQIQGAEGRLGFTRVLLGGQVALSIVLLAAAGLLAGSLVRLLTLSPGFDPSGVTVVSIDMGKLPRNAPALLEISRRIIERARALPGVESASLMNATPLTNSGWDNSFGIPGRPDIPEEDRDAAINAVAPQLLRTMRIRLLAGRDFLDSDTAQSEKVAIISESAARRWFPNGALGANIVLMHNSLRVVGISGDIKYLNLREDTPYTIYVPYTQWNMGGGITIRTEAPPRQTYAALRDIVRTEAPGAPIRTVRTMEETMNESLSTERLTAYLSLFFATLALLLTAVGLYGILAYSVSRRTGEIGIRMALGAQRGSVVWLVIREAMGHIAAGALVGMAAVAASSKLIASLLYGVPPNDPATMLLAVTALGLVCALAAWIPARRASRLDPMAALREE